MGKFLQVLEASLVYIETFSPIRATCVTASQGRECDLFVVLKASTDWAITHKRQLF